MLKQHENNRKSVKNRSRERGRETVILLTLFLQTAWNNSFRKLPILREFDLALCG